MRIRFAVRTGCHAVPQHKVYTAALCILLAFALLFAGVYITSALNEPEYYQGFSYTENDVTASEEIERNPNYLSGAKRQVYEFMYDFLRTPLTAMCGYIELMEREPQTENGKCYLAVIRERTDAMRALRRIFDNVISNAVKYSDGDFAVALDENGTATFTNGALIDRPWPIDSQAAYGKAGRQHTRGIRWREAANKAEPAAVLIF